VRRRRPEVEQSLVGEERREGVGRGRAEKIDRSFTMCVVAVLGITVIAVLVVICLPTSSLGLLLKKTLDSALCSLKLLPTQHAVVLDAGSTGSRVLAFTFHRHPVSGSLVLEDEQFVEKKPGLSSFADNPEEGAKSIADLLSIAKKKIPESAWADTPVTLMATAGLRLLPPDQSKALLAAVKSTLDSSGFVNKGVDIMSELDEGVFGWLTVNYLMDTLHNHRKSYVALDLGGGSTQITFAPKYDETFSKSPKTFLHPVKVSGTEQTLYSHSYLGLGLMSAREAVLRLHDAVEAVDIASACVVGVEELTYRKFRIVKESLVGYEACMMEVQTFIDMMDIDKCEEMPTRKIAAFSYFHDRAVDAGMIGEGESGVVTVQQYLDAAQQACDQPDPDSPFLCLDLTFISGLLHHGYRLSASAKLGLYKQIDGHQTSWGLGAAFNMLE